jgi:hypothetical protein
MFSAQYDRTAMSNQQGEYSIICRIRLCYALHSYGIATSTRAKESAGTDPSATVAGEYPSVRVVKIMGNTSHSLAFAPLQSIV